MLTEEEAKKIGLRACIEKIGLEFCKIHKDTAVCAYGVVDGVMLCYFGIDDQPAPDYENMKWEDLRLTSTNYLPYFAVCEVSMEDGTVTIKDFCMPEQNITLE